MKKILTKLNDIEEAKGTNRKKELLFELFKNHSESRDLLALAFDKTIYGVSKKSFEKAVNYDSLKESVYFDIGELMERKYDEIDLGVYQNYEWIDINYNLAQLRNAKGNNEKLKQLYAFMCYDSLFAKWISRIVLKDLKLGLNIKSINKVLLSMGKKEIPIFKVQLAGKFRLVSDYNLGFPVIAGIKYDGERCRAIKENGTLTLISRAGEIIDYTPEVYNYLNERFNCDFDFDLEICAKDFNTLQKRMGRKAENLKPIEDLHVRIFDVLKFNKLDFSEVFYHERRHFLNTFREDNIFKTEQYIMAENIDQIQDFYDKAIKNKEEGIMIKLLDSLYKGDSRTEMMKIKPFSDSTLLVTGKQLGTGRKAGMISTLYVEDKSGLIKSKASQLKDNDILEIMNLDREGKLIGTFVDIEYNELTPKDINGFRSLRFPRFLKIRYDKKEADDLSLEE